MNLLALSYFNAESPLVTNRVLPLLYELAGNGVKVSVFFPYGTGSTSVRRYESRLRYLFLQNQDESSTSSREEIDREARPKRDVMTNVLRFMSGFFRRLGLSVTRRDELRMLIRSFTFLRDFDADIIYAFKPFVGSAGLALALSEVKKIPVALDMDDYETIVRNPMLKNFDALTVASRALCKLYASYDPMYLPNSTDLELFKPKPKVSSGKPIIVWSGIMYEYLKLENLILALHKMRSDAILMFLGGGPLRAKLSALAKKLVPGRVFFNPWLERECVPYLLSKASVGVVYQSDTLYERCKCPGKLFEYMAMKLPVVATDVGEPRCVIKEAKCGMLLSEDDPMSLAMALDYLLEDDEARFEMGENGRNYLLTRQNYELLGSRLKELLLGIA